jgi:hypothetical protein
MKHKNFTLRIVVIVLIIAAVVAGVLFFVIKSNANTPEKTAEAILKKSYTAIPQDYDNITSAINSSRNRKDDTVLINYIRTFYGSGITENCLNSICNNRIPFRAEVIAHEQNSDIKVASIVLDPTDAETGTKGFRYIVQIHSVKDATKVFTFKGLMVLIQESGQWKVNAMS